MSPHREQARTASAPRLKPRLIVAAVVLVACYAFLAVRTVLA